MLTFGTCYLPWWMLTSTAVDVDIVTFTSFCISFNTFLWLLKYKIRNYSTYIVIGRNGESKKDNTADRMAIVVSKPSTGYLKKNLRPCHPVCGGYTVAILN